jgi:predicted ferric reductase
VSDTAFARTILTSLWLGGLLMVGLAAAGVPLDDESLAPFLAHACGLAAGYLSCAMVVLMARIPALDQRVGSDVLARWHSAGGRLFLALVLGHAAAAIIGWSQVRGIDPVTAALEVLGMPGLIAATIGTLLFIGIAAVSIGIARRRLSFESWHLIHLLTYVAIVLSFPHELDGPDLAGRSWLQVAWALMHAYALAAVLRYRVLSPLETTWRHRLRVVEVVPEADGVVSVILKGRYVDELGAEAGQFFRWRFLTAATWRAAHPFSLSSVPHGNLLRITVKALGDGSRLIHSVRPGTLVLAEGPSGAMTARRRSRPSVLLIAGGVGITPMRALFESIDVAPGALTLLYRASRPTDIVFREELEAIARARRARIIWLIGRSSDPGLQITGTNMLRWVPDVAQRDVYLCASPALSNAVRTALFDSGMPRHRLHEENFSF